MISSLFFTVGTPIFAQTPAPCRRTGCSGELCSNQNVISACLWRAEYACFSEATCERQANGSCGWTQTPGYLQCIQNIRLTPTATAGPVFPGDPGPPLGRVTPTPCVPRPACLDANPPCQLMPGYNQQLCPPGTTPPPILNPKPSAFPTPPSWINNLPLPMKNFLELLFTWIFTFHKSSPNSQMLNQAP